MIQDFWQRRQFMLAAAFSTLVSDSGEGLVLGAVLSWIQDAQANILLRYAKALKTSISSQHFAPDGTTS